MPRECRKCRSIIPTRFIFEGKVKTLCSRKYCLDCSPYGGHNTKKNIDVPSKKKSGYNSWDEETKLLHKARVYKRGIERKRKLVDMAGGCCIKCSYNKCLRALSFHHRNRDEKIFGLSLNELWSRKWTEVIDEYNKCDLLCLNCHSETEDEIACVNETKYRDIIARHLK